MTSGRNEFPKIVKLFFFQRRFFSKVCRAVHAAPLPQVLSLVGRGPRGLHGAVADHLASLSRQGHHTRMSPGNFYLSTYIKVAGYNYPGLGVSKLLLFQKQNVDSRESLDSFKNYVSISIASNCRDPQAYNYLTRAWKLVYYNRSMQ